MAEIILSRIRRPNTVQTLFRNRISWFEQLSTSEAHWSTTKSDGMCIFEFATSICSDAVWTCPLRSSKMGGCGSHTHRCDLQLEQSAFKPARSTGALLGPS